MSAYNNYEPFDKNIHKKPHKTSNKKNKKSKSSSSDGDNEDNINTYVNVPLSKNTIFSFFFPFAIPFAPTTSSTTDQNGNIITVTSGNTTMYAIGIVLQIIIAFAAFYYYMSRNSNSNVIFKYLGAFISGLFGYIYFVLVGFKDLLYIAEPNIFSKIGLIDKENANYSRLAFDAFEIIRKGFGDCRKLSGLEALKIGFESTVQKLDETIKTVGERYVKTTIPECIGENTSFKMIDAMGKALKTVAAPAPVAVAVAVGE